jgi:hypothetical protein
MRFELCGLVKLAGGGVEFRRHNTAILPRNRAPNTYKTYSSLKVRLMPKKVRLMPKKVRLMPKKVRLMPKRPEM